jgi:IclR family acetate operon transcriptional repressor
MPVLRRERGAAGVATGGRTHRSLARGLSVIEAVAALGGSATVSEISQWMGLPRSTTHHLLQALVDFGYLRQKRKAGAYSLAAKLFRILRCSWPPELLAKLARPVLDDLTCRTGEGTSLAILNGDGLTAMLLAKGDPDHPVRIVREIGDALPIHSTALGKVLVAWLPDREIDLLISRLALERKTARTRTDRAAFRLEMHRVKVAGFAIADEEQSEGIRSIATCVRDHTGRVCASLGVVGLKSQLAQHRLSEIRPILRAVADRLSVQLGFGATATCATIRGATSDSWHLGFGRGLPCGK